MTTTVVPHPPCADPVASPGAFADGYPGSGVDFRHHVPNSFTETEDLALPFAEVSAAGVAAADLDDDGYIDLFFAQIVGPNALFWGLPDGLYERAADGPWALPDDLTGTVRSVDIDGDGKLDLDVAGHDSVTMFRNLGDRRFEDITPSTGIVPRQGWPGGSAWADYDQDGDLDLFAGGYVERALTFPAWAVLSTEHAMWRNDGGVFTDQAADFGFNYDDHLAGSTIHAAFRDLDNDGDPDLFQVNDFGRQEGYTRPFENAGPGSNGWSWVDRYTDIGLGPLDAPMGVAIADLDGDGANDLWFSDLGSTTSYRGFSPYQWTDVSLVWGGELDEYPLDASWSTVPIDLDGDGTPAVYIAYGQLPPILRGPETPESDQPDRFLVSYPTSPTTIAFENHPEVFPSPQMSISRGAAIADLDRNGVPDLVIGHVRSAPSLLLGRCTSASRLVVELRDAASSNTFAVGAQVTVEVGDRHLVDEITGGGRGTFSSGEPVVFFGMGDAERADRVTVRWPDGEVTEWVDLPAHARLTATRQDEDL